MRTNDPLNHYHKFFIEIAFCTSVVLAGCQSGYMVAGKTTTIPFPTLNYDTGIDSLKKVLRANSTNPDAHIALGKLYAAKSSYNKACRQTENALNLLPEKLEELRNDSEFNYWAIFYNAGLAAFGEQHFYLTIKRIKRSLDFDSKSGISFNLLALCYEKLGKDDDAEKTYKKAVKLVPDNIDAYINLANFYKTRNKFEKAIKILTDAQKIVDDSLWLSCKHPYKLEERKKIKSRVHLELGKMMFLLPYHSEPHELSP